MIKPVLTLTLSLGLLLPALAIVESLPTRERRHGKEVQKAFEELRLVLQSSSAVVYADSPREVKDMRNKDRIAFACVMSADGLLLTKASELKDRQGLEVRVDETLYQKVEILAQEPKWDLALLKIQANDLKALDWVTEEPEIATWVVANGAASYWQRRVKTGIISARSREVKDSNSRAVVGVVFAEGKDLEIEQVHEKSHAAEVGIAAGDRITSVDGEKVKDAEQLRELLSDVTVGEVILLGIQRGDQALSFKVELRSSEDLYGKQAPNRNDGMSGRYSERRSNFPWVMQHEIPFSRISAGGPLLNLDGQCIGLNIARANRAETFAIPSKQILEAYAKLLKSAGIEP